MIGLACKTKSALQQRDSPAPVSDVLAQPGREDDPSRLGDHERRARAAARDLTMLGDRVQLPPNSTQRPVRTVRGIVRADDRQQTLQMTGKRRIDVACRRGRASARPQGFGGVGPYRS